MTKRTHAKLLQDLRHKLHIAIELEHSTIPAYLYAYWSIKDPTSSAATTILEVAKEEMNHMGMACNILNAVGGFVNCANKNFIPDYPTGLPGHNATNNNVIVGLEKLCVDSVVSFLQIELPRDPTLDQESKNGWTTIADFYIDILADIDQCDDEDFNHGRQLNPTDSPDAAGLLFAVRNKKTAKLCIAEIIEQGEGMKRFQNLQENFQMKSHYDRFLDLYHDMGGYGVVDENNFNADELKASVHPEKYREFLKGIHPMVDNPKQVNLTNKYYQSENLKFNSLYSFMLDNMHTHVQKVHPYMGAAISTMFALGRHAAAMRSIQLENGQVGGPSFEYVPRKERI